jgi:hypothetical protein
MAKKQQISPNLAEKMKMISESRFSNLMRSTTGTDREATATSGLTLKKIKLEIKPSEDEETDRPPPHTTFDILGSQTQKSQRIPLIRDCCARLKAKRGEPYIPGQRLGTLVSSPRSFNNYDDMIDDSGEGVISMGSGDLDP